MASRLVAWIIRARADRTARAAGCSICHGNAGNLSDAGRPAHYAGLRALGLNLLAFDYRGYGESDGEPTEPGLYADADAAYRYLRDTLGVPPERIVLFGHSLGSAVAVELATRVPAAGLVLDGALASVVERAQEAVPVRAGALDRPEPLSPRSRRSAGVRIPKLFLHARGRRGDPIRPRPPALRGGGADPRRSCALGGGHGDAFEVDSAAYFGAIATGSLRSLPS